MNTPISLVFVVAAFLIGVWSGPLIYGTLATDADHLATWFTGGQVAVALAQAALFLWQFTYLRGSVEAANAAAKAADVSANTAREAFTKLERPYLFIDGVTTIMRDSSVSGHEPCVRFRVANYGKTPAIIKHAAAAFSFDKPDAALLLDEEHSLLTDPVFGPGEVRKAQEVKLPLGIGFIDGGNDNMLLPDIKDNDLFLVITIHYRGAFTEGHQTNCCWRYDRPSGHFTQLGMGALNYWK
jgi:hypothetical protein